MLPSRPAGGPPLFSPPACGRGRGRVFRRNRTSPGCHRRASRSPPSLPQAGEEDQAAGNRPTGSAASRRRRKRQRQPHRAKPLRWQEGCPFSSPPACGRGRGRAFRRNGLLSGFRSRSSRPPPGLPRKRGRSIESPAIDWPETPPFPQAGKEAKAAASRKASSPAGGPPLLLPSRLREGSGEGLSARWVFAGFPPARQRAPTQPPPQAGEEERTAGNLERPEAPPLPQVGEEAEGPRRAKPLRRQEGCFLSSPPACGRGRGRVFRRAGSLSGFHRRGGRPPPGLPRKRGGGSNRWQLTGRKRRPPASGGRRPRRPHRPTPASAVGGQPLFSPPACGRGRGRASRRDEPLPGFYRRRSRPPPGLPRKRGRRTEPPAISNDRKRRLSRRRGRKQRRPYRTKPLRRQEGSPFFSPPACGRGRGRVFRRNGSLPGFHRRGGRSPPGLPRKRGRRIESPAIEWSEAPAPADEWGRRQRRPHRAKPLRQQESCPFYSPRACGRGRGRASRRDGPLPGCHRRGGRPPPGLPRKRGRGIEPLAIDWSEAPAPADEWGRRQRRPHRAKPLRQQESCPFYSPRACGRGRGRASRRDGPLRGFYRRASRPPPGLPRKRGRRIKPPAIDRSEAPPSPQAGEGGKGGRIAQSFFAGRREWPFGATGLCRASTGAAAGPHPASPASGGGGSSRWQSTGRKRGLPQAEEGAKAAASRKAASTASGPLLPSRLREGLGEGLSAQRVSAGFPPARRQAPSRPPLQAGEGDRAAGNRPAGSAASRRRRKGQRRPHHAKPLRRRARRSSPPACGRGWGRVFRRDGSLSGFHRRGGGPPPGLPCKRGRGIEPLAIDRPETPPFPQAGNEAKAAASRKASSPAGGPLLFSPPTCGRGRGGAFRRDGPLPGFHRRASRPPPGLPRKRGRRIGPPAIDWPETPPSPQAGEGGKGGRIAQSRFGGRRGTPFPSFPPGRRVPPSSPLPLAGGVGGGPFGATGLFRVSTGAAAGPLPASPASGGGGASRWQSTGRKRHAPRKWGKEGSIRRPHRAKPASAARGPPPFLPSRLREGPGEGLSARRVFAGFPPARPQAPTRPPPQAGEEERAAGNLERPEAPPSPQAYRMHTSRT